MMSSPLCGGCSRGIGSCEKRIPSRGSFKPGEFYPEMLVSGRDRLSRRKSATRMASRKHMVRFNRELAKAMERGIKGNKA